MVRIPAGALISATMEIRQPPIITLDLASVQDAVGRFQSVSDAESICGLRVLRRALVTSILEEPSETVSAYWTEPVREMHRLVAKSGLRAMPRDVEDEAILDMVCKRMSGQWGQPESAAATIAAMLLAYQHDTPLPPSLVDVPVWLMADYAAYLLEMPALFHRIGEADEYLMHLTQAVTLLHDFVVREPRAENAGQIAAVFANSANFIQGYFNTANLQRLFAQRGDILSRFLIEEKYTLLAAQPSCIAVQRIKLGIYALHFAPQTETFFMLSHFEHLDAERFDITLFTQTESGHALEKRCFDAADQVVLLPGGDLQSQVKAIRAADLDVLIIGTNAAAIINPAAVLGSHRLARIQVASVSSPVTTGLHHIDVLLSAEWNETAADAADNYTEYLYRMPGSVNCYAFQYDDDPPNIAPTREGMGIRQDQLVFFAGANYFKIIPELSLAWAHILAAVPDSVLILMPFNPNWSSQYEAAPLIARITEQMRSCGVEQEQLRLVMPVGSRADVHRYIELADIYLDAFPFAGACSMLDPLFVGVPPVAWRGETSRSSHGAAMLQMLNLQDLVANSADEYETLAIQLANNPSMRKNIRNKLLKAKQNNGRGILHNLFRRLSGPTRLNQPPYFDTRAFSRKVGVALEDLFVAYASHYDALRQMAPDNLRLHLQHLADDIVGSNQELESLTDLWIAEHLILPFLRGVNTNESAPLLIDVGACYGQMSLPFIAEGWHAVLFEPDPTARAILETNIATYSDRCSVVPAAAGKDTIPEVSFHKSKTPGLSGFGDSPFGATEIVLKVPCISLAEYCANEGLVQVDFLKIDAEGYDFDVLEGFDFTRFKPRLVMVEYGTHFPRQTISVVNEALCRMENLGYRAVIFNYDDDGSFNKGIWSYRLTDLFVSRYIPEDRASAFGNIIFYLNEDKEFLLSLITVLDSCKPRRSFWNELRRAAT